MFKIVAFDMDGTIADTIPMCIKAFRNSISPYIGHELSREEILHTFGLNETGMVKAVVSQKEKEYGISLEKIFYFQRGILLYRRYRPGYKRLPGYRRGLLFSGMAGIR